MAITKTTSSINVSIAMFNARYVMERALYSAISALMDSTTINRNAKARAQMVFGEIMQPTFANPATIFVLPATDPLKTIVCHVTPHFT